MDQRLEARRALRDCMVYWSTFVTKCISQRLETERFDEYVRLVHSKHRLPPVLVAELFLRPQTDNDASLDPRIPPYIQVLSQRGFVDAPSILRALYKFSSLHVQLNEKTQSNGQDDGSGNKGKENGKEEGKAPRRWRASSWAEEVMFYHVIKTVVEGTAFRTVRAAQELVEIISRWMALFTSASNAFAADLLGELQVSPVRDEMDVARAAFVPLLLRLIEIPALVTAISGPHAKGIRKKFADSLAGFTQTLQPAPGFVERLELFRTDTLARLDPVDKKRQAAENAAMDELLQTTVGLENLVIPDLPISNTRSALFIFFNASVSTTSRDLNMAELFLLT